MENMMGMDLADRGKNDQPVQLETTQAWKVLRNRFKSKNGDVPSLEGVIDFTAMFDSDLQAHEEIVELENLGSSFKGRLFGIKSRPGFVHAPGALSSDLQTQLAYLALENYCKPPHVTNVDAHMHRPKNKLTPKLSWASVGFHFNWTQRTYCDDEKSPFPEELSEITAAFAHSLHTQGYDGPGSKFKAETAIINYYKPQANMGAHVDDSEDDTVNPVVSITLGLPAVFLVGTDDKEDAPVPVLLRAGDVMMLSGKSRLCFHGIASVLPRTVPPAPRFPAVPAWSLPALDDKPTACSPQDRERVAYALDTYRININTRQVLLDGATLLQKRPYPPNAVDYMVGGDPW
eukprot:CAMPEP_0203793568 /NCGR_PEP_ID=MMETSP0100_2-20121128/5939_1 /ASSEMBLY_ACC=CAM_ASM_000210 /TAXON_ID=96639 /ORGANISM=" , Strain NY0313808BC1" /LENGTH=345 /DNA_ID=CAMNT_0050697365 /DNA_START=491 /DNA_END=1527 /DNA_ORIENTATION=-